MFIRRLPQIVSFFKGVFYNMATSSIGFLTSPSVSIDTGTKTIIVTGDVDCSFISSGTAVFLNGSQYMVEGISGTAPDSGGISSITLRETFTSPTLSNVPLTAFNTIEGLRDAIQRARELADANNISDQFITFLTDASNSITININGTNVTTTPYSALLQRVTDLEATTFDGGIY